MITRREFGLLATGAGLGLCAPAVVTAKGIPTVRMANASGVIDSQLIFFTAGLHPRLNYYGEESLQVEVVNMPGAGSSMQAVATGSVDVAPLSAPATLNVYARNPNIDILAAYCWLRQAHWDIGVKPDSPIAALTDLKGRRIGIRNQGDTGFFGARAMLKEIGINPDTDVEWIAIGDGGPAGDAVYKGRVDAMAFWDGAFARIDIAGFPLRFLPRTEGMKRLFGNAYNVRKSTFADNKDIYARFFRAMAKSTAFAYANPELSIQLAWEVFPETRPKGKSQSQAMTEALKIVDIRKDKWFPGAWAKDQRFGAMTTDEWEAQVEFVGLSDKIADVTPLFTNDLIDEVNRFDRNAIVAEARAMKL